MARAEINEVVINNLGAAVVGTAYTITTRGGGAASVYAASTGGTLATQVTDAYGRIEGWLDEGSYNLTISGYTSYLEQVSADARLTVGNPPTDPIAGVAGLRTLGTGAQQALPGNTSVAVAPAVVTSLPGSPTDGLEVIFQTPNDPLTGYPLFWRLRYRTATTKWDFIGGPSLVSQVATSEVVVAGAGYVAETTAGPLVALPVAGDYDIEFGFAGTSNAASPVYMSFDIGATGAVDADAAFGSGNGSQYAVGRTIRKTGLTAVTLTAKYKTANGLNLTAANRFMRVTPVRLG